MSDKPAIVFIHGDFGNGESSFAKAASEIGDGYRLLLLDRPGFAAGAEHPSRYTFADDAAAMLVEVSRLGAADFHLVGHSYGGLVAIEMTRQAPERVRSLTLIEPPVLALLDDDAARAMIRRVVELQAAHRDDDLDATTAAFFAMIDAAHVPERLRGTPEWDALLPYAARFARNEPPGDFPLATFEALPADLPVTVFSGGRSHRALRGVAELLAGRPQVRRYVHVPGAGHAVQMAGDAFVLPLLEEIAVADAAWPQRRPPADAPTS
ncbi:MAG: alpha/beta fold hydrolase [Thermomicrobiales bacterium]